MKVLITGPCGSGKTTLIKEMEKKGYLTTSGLEKEFWVDEDDVDDFEKAIFEKRLKIFERLQGKDLAFFDRGVIDPLVYMKYEGREIPEVFKNKVKEIRYDKVFVLEPLEEHHPNPRFDHLIKNLDDAKRWFSLMLETLEEFGYEPLIVKNTGIQARLEFILEILDKTS